MRADVGYGEYGEALENRIAIAEHRGYHFTDSQTETVIALATDMEIRESPRVAKLRQLT